MNLLIVPAPLTRELQPIVCFILFHSVSIHYDLRSFQHRLIIIISHSTCNGARVHARTIADLPQKIIGCTMNISLVCFVANVLWLNPTHATQTKSDKSSAIERYDMYCIIWRLPPWTIKCLRLPPLSCPQSWVST